LPTTHDAIATHTAANVNALPYLQNSCAACDSSSQHCQAHWCCTCVQKHLRHLAVIPKRGCYQGSAPACVGSICCCSCSKQDSHCAGMAVSCCMEQGSLALWVSTVGIYSCFQQLLHSGGVSCNSSAMQL
jgi:hypothetical protein